MGCFYKLAPQVGGRRRRRKNHLLDVTDVHDTDCALCACDTLPPSTPSAGGLSLSLILNLWAGTISKPSALKHNLYAACCSLLVLMAFSCDLRSLEVHDGVAAAEGQLVRGDARVLGAQVRDQLVVRVDVLAVQPSRREVLCRDRRMGLSCSAWRATFAVHTHTIGGVKPWAAWDAAYVVVCTSFTPQLVAVECTMVNAFTQHVTLGRSCVGPKGLLLGFAQSCAT